MKMSIYKNRISLWTKSVIWNEFFQTNNWFCNSISVYKITANTLWQSTLHYYFLNTDIIGDIYLISFIQFQLSIWSDKSHFVETTDMVCLYVCVCVCLYLLLNNNFSARTYCSCSRIVQKFFYLKFYPRIFLSCLSRTHGLYTPPSPKTPFVILLFSVVYVLLVFLLSLIFHVACAFSLVLH